MKWDQLICNNRLVQIDDEELLTIITKSETRGDKKLNDEFENDYRKIVFSSVFRRLQDKTQVFPLEQSDFVRTRLTHSIEVSAIGKELGMGLKNKRRHLHDELKKDERIDAVSSILACAGLLHDIGNPPFGHYGEEVIRNWFEVFFDEGKRKDVDEKLTDDMKYDLKHFDGNAQNIRILSKVYKNTSANNLNITYAVMGTLIKYPNSAQEMRENGDRKIMIRKKLGFFYSERDIVDTIASDMGMVIGKGDWKYCRHPLAFLLEAADDIAYATADLEDAMKKRLFSAKDFVEYCKKELKNKSGNTEYTAEVIDSLDKRIDSVKAGTSEELNIFRRWTESVRSVLINAALYGFTSKKDKIISGIYQYDLFHDSNHQYTMEILHDAMGEYVYNNFEILKRELTARKVIGGLLDDFVPAMLSYGEDTKNPSDTYRRLQEIISKDLLRDYRCEIENIHDEAEITYRKIRTAVDYISGMTDSFALNLYQELNGVRIA